MKPANAVKGKKGFAIIPIEGRFWERVRVGAPDECWEWQAGRDYHGYGSIHYQGRHWKASRIAWELTNGPIPPGMHVCHSCDNPPCVNPAHLWLGTMSQNIQDAVRKGRHTIRSTSGHRGVSWSKQRKLWNARIRVNGKRLDLGFYRDVDEAAEAYRLASLQYHCAALKASEAE